jgi:hypothetical protein
VAKYAGAVYWQDWGIQRPGSNASYHDALLA